jgi:glycosyltransferase involved in cell wall biosynthesis
MLIGIDGNEANEKLRVGVGQFAYNILINLAKLDKKNKYIVYLKNSPASDFPKTSSNWQYKVFGPKKFWTKLALPIHLFLQKEKLDLFFSPSHYSPHFSPFPTIPTIHDIGYLQYKDQFTKKDYHQLVSWTKRSLDTAKHIIAVSQFSKNELIKTYQIPKEKISVVYNGITPPKNISSETTTKTLHKFSIKKPYFLYLGTLKPSKNISLLIEVFKDYLQKHPQHQLVIAGKKGWLYNDIFSLVQKLDLAKSVIFTDYISETEKWILYQNAFCTVLPSFYEGFGIPVIESQICRTPVIASSIPSITEIAQDSCLFFDPHDKKQLFKAMEEIIKPEIRQKLIKNGVKTSSKFTWENSAKSLIEVFDKL